MLKENQIRDFLAHNLNFIENGLTLIRTEYHLPNDNGADGFIDILAKDIYGMLVVLEIKKSNQAARQAIHELHKYVALLVSQGISIKKIRCIIVSTTWHELLVPFSSFQQSAEFHVDGFHLHINEDDEIVRADLITLTDVQNISMPLCPLHMIYLFSSQQKRDNSVVKLSEIAKSFYIENFCILHLDSSQPEKLMYPFALYFVMSMLTTVEKNLLEASFSQIDNLDEEYYYEENSLCRINDKFLSIHDDIEVSNPDKFSHLRKTWTVSDHYLSGILNNNPILDIKAILTEIAGFNNTSLYSHCSFLCPKFEGPWDEALEHISLVLRYCDFWKEGIFWFLQKIQYDKNANVSIKIFHPNNILMSLYGLRTHRDLSYLPSFELIVTVETSVHYLYGTLLWDPNVFCSTPLSSLSGIAASIDDFMIMTHTGLVEEFNAEITERHGLSYSILYKEFCQEQQESIMQFTCKNGFWEIIPFDDNHPTILDFLRKNENYFKELVIFVENFYFRS